MACSALGGVTWRTSPEYRNRWDSMHSLFSRIFGRKQPQQQIARLEVTGQPSAFTSWNSDPWANDLYRAGVDSIARVFAKSLLVPRVTFSDDTDADADERLARILQVRPNSLMSAYDLLYVLVVHLYCANNAYCYLQREQGQIVAVWPLHVTACELVTAQNGATLAALTFANGKQALLPYQDVVHLRRHQNHRDALGDSNAAIDASVQLADAQNRGIIQSIGQGGQIRGLVRYAGSLSPSKLEEYQRHFDATQLRFNDTGIILTPSEIEFVPVAPPPTINAQDLEMTKKKIWSYLGVSESIVDSSFSDDQFAAFDESIIESLALQFSLEFTSKVYSPLQVARGRRIECSTQRIKFIGVQHRNELVTQILPMGAISVNEGRSILGLPPIEDGDRFIQSLNYIDVDAADDYQLARAYISARKDGRIPTQIPQDEEPDEAEADDADAD